MLLFGAALAVFCVALVRTAWLNDDCFITQRVVDHLRLGFGPRWNISERVQAFTSPAWLAVMTLAELVTHEAFYTLLALGAGVSLAALFVLARRVSPSPELGALALLVLALCPSFVEYSTSGMEQPLAHLLLALLLARAARFDGSPRQLRQAGLLVAALVLTRPDFALLVAPVSVALLQHTRASLRQLALQLVIAASPVLAWELFSLVYYGMLVPNTALAKLGTGASLAARIHQGLRYSQNQLHGDPLSLATIALALLALAAPRRPRFAVAWMAGVLLYLEYVISIGGCFMLGRYFTAPLLVALGVLVQSAAGISRRALAAGALAASFVGLQADHPALLSPRDYGRVFVPTTTHGVSDERQFYYRGTGLLPNLGRPGPHPDHPFASGGDFLAQLRGVQPIAAAGMTGWRAGPAAHLVDVYALSDPLLARLPALQVPLPAVHVGIGHHARRLPVGYVRTLVTGADLFQDRQLARFYWQVQLVTRGPLLSPQRWVAIWKLNTGGYDALIDQARYAQAYLREVPYAELSEARSVFGLDVLGVDPLHALLVTLPEPRHEPRLALALGSREIYELSFQRAGHELATLRVMARARGDSKVLRLREDVPPAAVDAGYDAILIRRVSGLGPPGIARLRLISATSAEDSEL